MRPDLLFVSTAEPRYRRVYNPDDMRHATFAGPDEVEVFRRRTLQGPPLARLDGVLLNIGNLAARYVDGGVGFAQPVATHYPDAEVAGARPRVPSSTRFLNGIYLADFLDREGLAVEVINHLEEDEELALEALARDPVAIGVSSTFLPNRESVDRAAGEFKQRRPDLPVIVGGPHVAQSFRVLNDPAYAEHHVALRNSYLFLDEPDDPSSTFDYAVIDARGEETLAKLVRALRTGGDPRSIPNVVYRGDDRRWRVTSVEPEGFDPARHYTRWEQVPDHRLGQVVSVQSSSGCPFPCTFCNFDSFRSGMGVREPAAVARDLLALQARGFVERVYFTDDILFATRDHMHAFARTMQEAGVRIPWGGFARADLIRHEDAVLLRQGSCGFLNFGIESGAPTVLRNMKKPPRPDRTLETIGAVNRLGIWTNSALLLGFPGETPETVDQTIALLNAYPTNEPALNFYATYVFNVMPYSGILNERERFRLEGISYDWRHATMSVAEASREHRRLDLAIEGAVLAYPGDLPGLPRYLNGEASSFSRLMEVVRRRKAVERAEELGPRANGALRAALDDLGDAVRRAVGARAGVPPAVGVPPPS
jgi:p-methyltransferase